MLNLELSIAKGMMLTEKFKTIKNDYIIPWKKTGARWIIQLKLNRNCLAHDSFFNRNVIIYWNIS